MWQMLIPTALNVLQGDSNRKAQMEQDAINREFSPWLGNNPAGQFNTQTNDGASISAGLQAYNNAETEKKREQENYDRMFNLLNPEGFYDNKFKALAQKPAQQGFGIGYGQADPSQFIG